MCMRAPIMVKYLTDNAFNGTLFSLGYFFFQYISCSYIIMNMGQGEVCQVCYGIHHGGAKRECGIGPQILQELPRMEPRSEILFLARDMSYVWFSAQYDAASSCSVRSN